MNEEYIKYANVYYIRRSGQEEGSEVKAGRPAVIVSSRVNNRYGPTVNVVYLSDKAPKLPVHVSIPARDALRDSVAMCEQVTTVSKRRIGDYITTLSIAEMQAISAALKRQLNL